MAGLSIARRRKAWLKGVAYGASGRGKCLYTVEKLRDIFQRGVLHGRTHAGSPYARAVVDQEIRRRGGGKNLRSASARPNPRGYNPRPIQRPRRPMF